MVVEANRSARGSRGRRRAPALGILGMLVLGILGMLVLGGCGSSGPAKPASAPTVPGHSAPAGNGEAAKPALRILMDAAGAMRGVRGYRVEARITGSRLTRIDLTINSP